MSFIQGPNNTLVRDMWPADLPKLLSDSRDMMALAVHEVVPLGLDELYRWAYLTYDRSQRDVTRRNMLLYSPTLFEDNRMQRVVLRIQGFVLKYNLKPLGTWNKEEATAHKALQYLTLHSGGNNVPFAAQCNALANIREYIFRALGTNKVMAPHRRGVIHLQRKVFTKFVRDSDQQSALSLEEDPEGDAAAIQKKWIVSERASLAMQSDDGILKRCSYMVFQRGDFIEVSIVADIVSRGQAGDRSTDVLFAFRDVILLKSVAFQPRKRERHQREVTIQSGIQVQD